MTRRGREVMVGIWEDETWIGPLPHLAHKSKVLDWTQGQGPGGGNAPSDLARSIVGDFLEDPEPAPALYREVTPRLTRIPYEGGELTEEEVLDLVNDSHGEIRP